VSTVTALAVVALLGLFAGLAARRWLLTTARVESDSMAPAYRHGHRVLVRRVRGLAGVRRGDVLLLDSPDVGRLVVKRVVGLPGERVDVDADGRVTVDQRPLSEPYVARPAGPAGTFSVPVDSVLVLGDNRPRSSDSRTWTRPYVPSGAIFGKIVAAPPGR
jgi:signal peptidase I